MVAVQLVEASSFAAVDFKVIPEELSPPVWEAQEKKRRNETKIVAGTFKFIAMILLYKSFNLKD